MQLVKKINWNDLQHEYGLNGKRLLPWDGLFTPFGGAYCVVVKGSTSMDHVNRPEGEEELFVGISGKATVRIGNESFLMEKGDMAFIPAGMQHYVENSFDEDFHFFTIWWNEQTVQQFYHTKTDDI